MKKKLMIILAAAFLIGNLGLSAQVVNTDVPTEDVEEEDIDEEVDEDEDEDEEEESLEVLSEDEFAVTDEEGNEEVIEFPEAMTYDLDSLLNLYMSKTYLGPTPPIPVRCISKDSVASPLSWNSPIMTSYSASSTVIVDGCATLSVISWELRTSTSLSSRRPWRPINCPWN